jgi:hypothetical protein
MIALSVSAVLIVSWLQVNFACNRLGDGHLKTLVDAFCAEQVKFSGGVDISSCIKAMESKQWTPSSTSSSGTAPTLVINWQRNKLSNSSLVQPLLKNLGQVNLHRIARERAVAVVEIAIGSEAGRSPGCVSAV